jgi:NIMA (never in mitosis gene a)-related kinase 1/4/5
LLKQLGHPNIVAYKDSYSDNGNINIVMSYCEGGDMYNKIKDAEGKQFPESVISF